MKKLRVPVLSACLAAALLVGCTQKAATVAPDSVWHPVGTNALISRSRILAVDVSDILTENGATSRLCWVNYDTRVRSLRNNVKSSWVYVLLEENSKEDKTVWTASPLCQKGAVVKLTPDEFAEAVTHLGIFAATQQEDREVREALGQVLKQGQ